MNVRGGKELLLWPPLRIWKVHVFWFFAQMRRLMNRTMEVPDSRPDNMIIYGVNQKLTVGCNAPRFGTYILGLQ